VTATDLRHEDDAAVVLTPRRLTHANLFVADWQKSFAFYRDIIGLNESYTRPPFKAGFLTNGATHHDIAVMEFSARYWKRAPRPIGLFHVAFEMEHDLALCRWHDRALELGVEFSMIEDHRNTHSLYMYDPDGNQIEVYVDTLKDWTIIKSGTIQWMNREWRPWDPPPTTETFYIERPVYARVEAAPFHPLHTTHAVFVARDYPAMVRFYSETLGLQPVAGGLDRPFIALQGTLGDRSVSLFRAGPELEPGFHHVGLIARDERDLERSIGRAKAQGVAIEAVVDHPVRLSVMIRDLDGHRVQLYAERDGTIDWVRLDPTLAIHVV
jgi:catechol 2,3-dioxygenase